MDATKDHLVSLKQVADALELSLRTIALALQETEALRMNLQFRNETSIEQTVEGTLQPLPLPTVPVCDHRREHRPGKPRIISTDPALQAFITARLDRMTFDEIAADVTLHFPPERQVKKSAIHAWYQSTRKTAKRNPGRPADHSG